MGTGLKASIKGTFPKGPARDGSYHQPGPGEYSVNRGFVEKSTPQYTIGGKYANPRKDELPGPGNYDANPDAFKYASPAPAFGKTRRTRTERTSEAPGPGEYAAPVDWGKGFTIGGKTQSKIPQTPGPGQYETPEQQIKGFTMRHRPVEKSPESHPGPGLYDLKVEEPRGFTIGGKSGEKVREGPGPGQYQHRDFMGKDTPAVTLRGRPEDRHPEQLPGPGMYEYPDQERRGFTIGQKKDHKIP